MRAEAQNTVAEIEKSLELLRQRLNWDTAQHRLEEFNARVEDPTLWDDPEAAQKLMRDRQTLIDSMDVYTGIKQELQDNIDMIELGEMEEDDEVVKDAEAALKDLAKTAAHKPQLLISFLSCFFVVFSSLGSSLHPNVYLRCICFHLNNYI